MTTAAIMSNLWAKRLKEVTRELRCKVAHPIWWDGFYAVIVRGESPNPTDNPYLPTGDEKHAHAQYKAGAKAAESLNRYLPEDVTERNTPK